MPRAQKGQRFGGRTKGTPNKSIFDAWFERYGDVIAERINK